MTTRTRGHLIDVRGTPVEVFRKDIKNLHVGVYPPSGRVRVAAPLGLDDNAIRIAVISRLGWIRRQQAEFKQQDRQSQREFVTGESHYFEGRRYRLDVVEFDGRPLVRPINNTTLMLRVRPGNRQRRLARLCLIDGIAVSSVVAYPRSWRNGNQGLESGSARFASRR